MKNKKFAYMLSGVYLTCVIVLIAFCVGLIVFSFLRIFGAFGLGAGNLFFEILIIFATLLFLVLLISILTCRYVVSNHTIMLKFCFIDTTRGKFHIDKLIKIVRATNAEKLFINLYVGDIPQIVLINIQPKYFDKFVDAIREANSKVLYEEADLT